MISKIVEITSIKPVTVEQAGQAKKKLEIGYVNLADSRPSTKSVPSDGKVADSMRKLGVKEGSVVEFTFIENSSGGKTYHNISGVKMSDKSKVVPKQSYSKSGSTFTKKDDSYAKGQRIGNALSNAVLLVVHDKEKDLEIAAMKIINLGAKLEAMDLNAQSEPKVQSEAAPFEDLEDDWSKDTAIYELHDMDKEESY